MAALSSLVVLMMFVILLVAGQVIGDFTMIEYFVCTSLPCALRIHQFIGLIFASADMDVLYWYQWHSPSSVVSNHLLRLINFALALSAVLRLLAALNSALNEGHVFERIDMSILRFYVSQHSSEIRSHCHGRGFRACMVKKWMPQSGGMLHG